MKIQTQGFIVTGLITLVAGFDGLVASIVTKNLSQTATAVNQAGLVRGGTQRLVKLKLFGANQDVINGLIQKTNQRVEGLINGDDELKLPKINKPGYQSAMNKVKTEWQNIKELVSQPSPNPKALLETSETFFKTTDEAVSAAELVAKQEEKRAELLEIISWILAGVIVVITFAIMQNIVHILRKTSTELATSSTEIAASIVEQEKVISQQAASVNQTTTTMEELGASSRQSAEQALASSSSSQKALELSNVGKGAVGRTVEGIDILKENVSAIAEKIMQLSEQTAQISTVSELVADIANQTNILALNAAVEAARAGEQGKGFSVVAQEVRKLADQSKKSADKISNLIREIQASINSTVMVTDEGTKTASESIRLAHSTAEVFESIVEAVQTISVNTQQIALSSKQQAVGVQQGVSAMNAINLGAREAASSVSQLKTAVQQLSESAQLLKEQI